MIKKKFITLLFAFLAVLFKAQNIEFTPTIKVTYQSTLKLGLKSNAIKEDFVLIGNSNDYYFAAKQNYLNDTNQYESSGGIDLQFLSAEFPERIIKFDNQNFVYISTSGGKIRYEELNEIKWVLYGDIKMINGVKCQLATTNLFGRRWYAYFSKEYTQNIGPYKFSGLPGIILELYDQRDDYHFTAVSIEKNVREFKFNISGFKNFSKKDYFTAKDNMLYGIGKYPGLSGDMLRQTQEMLGRLKNMNNNPIELKPFN